LHSLASGRSRASVTSYDLSLADFLVSRLPRMGQDVEQIFDYSL
jgi:hypothetical protein